MRRLSKIAMIAALSHAQRPSDAMRELGWSVRDTRIVRVKQRTPEWFAERALCISTASNAAAMAGLDSQHSPLYAAEKQRTREMYPDTTTDAPAFVENQFMRHGTAFEPLIRHDFYRRVLAPHGLHTVEGGFYTRDICAPGDTAFMRFGASPDVEMYTASGALAALGEIKGPRSIYASDDKFAYPVQGGIVAFHTPIAGLPVKADHLMQMTQQMLVADIPVCVYTAYDTYHGVATSVVVRFSPTLAGTLFGNSIDMHRCDTGELSARDLAAPHPVYVFPSPDWDTVAKETDARPLSALAGTGAVTPERVRALGMGVYARKLAEGAHARILFAPGHMKSMPAHTDPLLHARARAILDLEEQTPSVLTHAHAEDIIDAAAACVGGDELLAQDMP